MITQAELKRLFDYRDDGNLIRKVATGGQCGQIGTVIGSVSTYSNRPDKKYISTKIQGISYKVHRLIFLWHNGYLPEQLDHINRITLDNRIENLRPATISENASNRKIFSSNTSGAKGVSWHKISKKWFVYIDINKKRKNIGYFDDFELAELVSLEAHDKFHGAFVI